MIAGWSDLRLSFALYLATLVYSRPKR